MAQRRPSPKRLTARQRRVLRARRRRRAGLGGAVVLLVAVVAGYLALAHRVSRPSLSYSIATSGLDPRAGALLADCEPSDLRDWTCSLESANRHDGGIVYLMRTAGDCWSARLSANFSGLALPGHVRGCVGIADQLRITDLSRWLLGSSSSARGFF